MLTGPKRKDAHPGLKNLLVIDTAYTLNMMRKMNLFHPVLCRDLDGFFDHVWTVNSCVGAAQEVFPEPSIGRVSLTTLNSKHTIVEGKIGLFQCLTWLPALNFVFAQLRTLFFLDDLIKTENISVIRTGDPYYMGIVAFILACWNRIPFLIRVCGNYDECYKSTGKPNNPRLFRYRFVEKIIERFILQKADMVAGVNQDNLNFALANGAKQERTTLFRYGNLINPIHFLEPDQRITNQVPFDFKDNNKPFLIYIGRLEKVKRPDDVLKILSEVKKHKFDIDAVLVGDGTMKSELKQLAKDLEIEKNVWFVGNKDQTWIGQILPQACIVISPHTGRALVEAALSGTPVVAYDIDWQAELIRTGKTGILVKYGDWKSMALEVIKLLEYPVEAEKIGTLGRAEALAMMNPHKLSRHEQAVYAKLLRMPNCEDHTRS